MTTGSGLPPPPPPPMTSSTSSKSYAQSISKSMTIEEMRELHQRALNEAEAKRTELRLVLASRYRELVGSSDEVLKMRERSQELHELVHALPGLLSTLVQENETMARNVQSTAAADTQQQQQEESKESLLSEEEALSQLRRDLSHLPRVVHRCLDQHNVHGAGISLIQLFTLLAQQTDAYPLANALAKSNGHTTRTVTKHGDPNLKAQMKMTFLYVQTLPDKITRLSKQMLENAASYGPLLLDKQPPVFGSQWSAAALSALDLLDTKPPTDGASKLLDLYFDSKAQLLQSLLSQLQMGEDKQAAPDNAEEILSKILLILQYDVILHPFQIFVCRRFPVNSDDRSTAAETVMATLPTFDALLVRAKCSHFLAAHIPLLRTKVKSILVSIAGTTASALGQMRQSLYDKTDGADCMAMLRDEDTNLCTWDDAVAALVDIPTVAAGGGMPVLPADKDGPRFSLWSALFSNTFSSLVHSLLTTSFHSVHAKVVNTLRTSLASAPSLEAMRPHEAYRNTLKIATDLDQALWNVRKDAHELLVHAEEREESERRLRLSLYVQTCEIMGRLVCELRRMIQLTTSTNSFEKTNADAVQELIVGRLCYLLKFRLTSLPTLLDAESAPSSATATAAAANSGGGASGMINLLELQSAFELADDNDDGLITFEEAMEAVDSAFSGTTFHGAEMVRETLLLNSDGAQQQGGRVSSSNDLMASAPKSSESVDLTEVGSPREKASSVAPVNVTLSELALLTARGLRHETTGSNSALGTVQQALDNIVENCFLEWAKASLRPSLQVLTDHVEDFYKVASTTSENEWHRLYHTSATPESGPAVEKVAPSVVGYLLEVSSVMNRTIFPTDSLLPVPSLEYASSLGIIAAPGDTDGSSIPTMKDTIRWSLVRQSLALITNTYLEIHGKNRGSLENPAASALLQLKADLSFIQLCFFERLRGGLAKKFEQQQMLGDAFDTAKNSLQKVLSDVDSRLRRYPNAVSAANTISEKHQQVLDATDLFLSSLLGGIEEATAATGAPPMESTSQAPFIHNPLPSSRRFALLPVQSDRGLTEMQLRKYGKKNQDNENNQQDSTSSGVSHNFQKGLGLFSNFLRT